MTLASSRSSTLRVEKVVFLRRPSLDHPGTLFLRHLPRRICASNPQALCPTITSGSQFPSWVMNRLSSARSLGARATLPPAALAWRSRSWGKWDRASGGAEAPRGRTRVSWVTASAGGGRLSRVTWRWQMAERQTISCWEDLGCTTVFILRVTATRGGTGGQGSGIRRMFLGSLMWNSSLVQVEGTSVVNGFLTVTQPGPISLRLIKKFSVSPTECPKIL
mmetsp:Transcript_39120/g.91116  ORF Transcript_39120/g.91116 Transcript_39120/m.91116 type:complete len:220 (+) Transcript_39120:2390-3049(+)